MKKNKTKFKQNNIKNYFLKTKSKIKKFKIKTKKKIKKFIMKN